MGIMLIHCIIFLLGISVGDKITAAVDFESHLGSVTKNSSLPSFKSSLNKRKRDVNFDDSSIYSAKKTSFFDNNSKNGFFVPLLSTSKVSRSAPNSFLRPPQSSKPIHFQTADYNSNIHQIPFQPSKSKFKPISNKNQSLLERTRLSNILPNQGRVPYYERFVPYPVQLTNLNNANTYKTLSKVPYSTKLSLMDYTSTVPAYPFFVTEQKKIISSQPYQVQSSAIKANKLQNFQDFKSTSPHMYLRYSNGQDQRTPFQSFTDKPIKNILYTTASTFDVHSQKTPNLYNTQNASKYSNYPQSKAQPIVVYSSKTGLAYATQPASGTPYDYSNTKTINQRSGTSIPFLNRVLRPDRAQVVPVHASSSTAEFPRYKGASISQSPRESSATIPDEYQDFRSQTYLHFGGENDDSKIESYPVSEDQTKLLESIRTDVELIDKNNPIQPLKDDIDNNDDGANSGSDDEGHESEDTYLPKSEENSAEELPLSYKESEPEDFFESIYDDKFQKSEKKLTNEKNNDDDDDDDVQINLAANYHFFNNDDINNKDENNQKSVEDKTQPKLNTHPTYSRLIHHGDKNNNKPLSYRKEDFQKTKDSYYPDITKTRTRQSNFKNNYGDSFKTNRQHPTNLHHTNDESNESSHSQDYSHSSHQHSRTTPKYVQDNWHPLFRDENHENFNNTTSENTQNFSEVQDNTDEKSNSEYYRDPPDNWRNSYEPSVTTEDSSQLQAPNNRYSRKLPKSTFQNNSTKLASLINRKTIIPRKNFKNGYTTFVSHKNQNVD